MVELNPTEFQIKKKNGRDQSFWRTDCSDGRTFGTSIDYLEFIEFEQDHCIIMFLNIDYQSL